MRTFLSFIFLFVTFNIWSQEQEMKAVPRKVQMLETANTLFQKVNPFSEAIAPDRLETIELVKKDAWGLIPDKAVLASLLKGKPDYIEMMIPDHYGKAMILRLYKVSVGTKAFKAMSSDGYITHEIPGVHYRGIVKGDYYSLVSMSIFDDHVAGFVATNQGNRVLGLFEPRQDKDMHIFYDDRTIAHLNPFKCDMEDWAIGKDDHFDPSDHGHRAPGDCVGIWWEVDDDITNNKGGFNPALTWMTGMTAQVYTLYANETIDMATATFNIWTTPDPYTGNSSSARLSSFQSLNGTLDGDLAHYVNLTSSYGGIAAGFSGICAANYDASMCYSGLTSTYQNVPTYSWTIMVCTHEMGHLIGSRHTHACVWNGNNTAIDGCAGFTEGGCPLPGQPPGGGTIMSYCHQNVGINFNLGFGPQPGNVIRNTINNANCLQWCDPPPPGGCTFSISCPATTTVQCGPNPLPAQTGNPTITILSGNCSPTISYTDNNQFLNQCNGTGYFVRTFTVTEGNTSLTCTQTINKIDNTPPVINGVPANISLNCSAPVPAPANVSATDNCGVATLYFEEQNVQQPCGFIITRTWTAYDDCGNNTARTQTITVTDTAPPVARCKGATINIGANGNGVINVADVDDGSFDICSTITLSVSPSIVNCSNIGPMQVVLTVTDGCGNVASCVANVTVTDPIKPTMSCRQSLDLEIDEWGSPIYVTWQDIDLGSSDNCGIVDWQLTKDEFTCDHIGNNTVKLFAMDGSGNTSECQLTIRIRDLIPPTFLYVPEDMTVYCVEPKPEDMPEAYDNCGEVSWVFDEQPHYIPHPENAYAVQRKWTFLDKVGNTSVHEQWITVLAEGELAIVCNPDITTSPSRAPRQAWWDAPKVNDICWGNVPMEQIGGPASGSYFNPGTRTRITYEYVNDRGNRYQCAFHVIVPLEGNSYAVTINQAVISCDEYITRTCYTNDLPSPNNYTMTWRPRGFLTTDYYSQNGTSQIEIAADGTGIMRGTWSRTTGVPAGWNVEVYFYHRRNAEGWQSVGSKTINPLGVTTSDWDYMEIDPSRSVMYGTGANAGKILTVKSSIPFAGYGLQLGAGANGVTNGNGGWFAISAFSDDGKLEGHGEFNFITNCNNNPFVREGGKVTSLDGQTYDAKWSNGQNGSALGTVAPGTYTVSVTLPGGTVQTHTFSLVSPTGCVALWQDACREANRSGGAIASQGSTHMGAKASKAVDGNTNGDMSAGSVSSTLQGSQNFWRATLTERHFIESVRVWPRTDCCSEQLNQYYLFVSDNPIPDKTPEELLQDANVRTIQYDGRMNESWRIPVNGYGRYIKLQLRGAGQLQLAEVEALVCQPDRLDPPTKGGNIPFVLGAQGIDAGVYPNPASSVVDIVINRQEVVTNGMLVIRNIHGQEMVMQALPSAETARITVDVSQWPQGLYMMTAQTGEGMTTQLLTIQR